MVNILFIADDAVSLPPLLESLAFHIPKARVDSHQVVATAIDQIRSRAYQVIVIDTHTTALDSLALISQILDLQPNALTIFVTDREDHALMVRAFQRGAYDLMTRPIDQHYLVASLKRAARSVQLTELNRLKDELFAGISHGLRTHLNSILNWAQLMRSEKLDEPTCYLAAEMIERGIKEQVKLVERIDDLPRAIAANLPDPFEPIERNTLVKQLLGSTRADALAQTQETSVPASEGVPLQGLKILVVDDETDGRELLRIMLSQFGATVTAVESVKEALASVRQFMPDILVSDIGMPFEDGYSLIRHIRNLKTGERVAALALTAYATPDDYRKTKAAGFDAHLCKPVEPAKLVRAVESLAGRNWENAKGRRSH